MAGWFDTPEWKWRRQRWRLAWQDFRGRWSDGKRQATYRNKICPECGAILGRNEPICERCGAKVGGWWAQFAARLIRWISPGEVPVTFLLIAANLIPAFFTLQPDPRLKDLLWGTGALLFPQMQAEGSWWRLLTYGFLHGGILHIVFNMMALYQFGPELEKTAGSRRFFVLYTLSILGGGLADLWVRGSGPLFALGASGAICGLIGASLAYVHLRGLTRVRDQLISGIAYMILYSAIFELTGSVRVDHLAHAGGFVTGAIIGALVEREERLREESSVRLARLGWKSAQWICGLALLWAGYQWWQAIGHVSHARGW